MTKRRLPANVYYRHGAYYHVTYSPQKWTRLHSDLSIALMRYAQIIEGQHSKTMSTLIDKAHPYIILNKKPNTVKQYDYTARVAKNILAEFDYDQVTARDIAAIKNAYAKQPYMGNRILTYLRLVFEKALEWQLVNDSPCAPIRRHAEPARTRYLNDAEYKKLRAHAGEALRVILDVLYLTGQRIGDVLRIKKSDITDEGIYFEQEKTGNRLIIGMSDDLREAIDNALHLPRCHKSEYLFTTMRYPRPYSYGTVRDMFRAAVKRAGLRDCRIHDIRAKAVTDADAQGLDATALAGHTSARQTERYLRQRRTTIATPPRLKK